VRPARAISHWNAGVREGGIGIFASPETGQHVGVTQFTPVLAEQLRGR
jgi:hypothetical protein